MSELTSSDGTTIGYEIQGAGSPIILIDGAMCYRGSGPLDALATALADEFTVVTYDRRGRGSSTDTLPYAVDREIDDLAALINVVGGKAALFGMSSGGALAVLTAARMSAAVTDLIVYEPPFMPEPVRAAITTSADKLAEALRSGDRDTAVATFLARVGTPDASIERMRRSPNWASMVAIAPTLGYDDFVMGDSGIPKVAAQLVVRALAIAGGASPEFLRWGAENLARAIPGGEFTVLEGQTHDVATAPLAQVIRQHLQVARQRA